MGEDADGAAQSVTKLQSQILKLTNNKVDIMLDADTFRSTYDIIVDLSKVWSSLSDKTQADLTRLVAGNDIGLSMPYMQKCAYYTVLNPVTPESLSANA